MTKEQLEDKIDEMGKIIEKLQMENSDYADEVDKLELKIADRKDSFKIIARVNPF